MILVVSSIFLFVGMGINYRLLDKEKKEEERRAKMEDREDLSNKNNTAKEFEAFIDEPGAAEEAV